MILRTLRSEKARKIRKMEGRCGLCGLRARKVDCRSTSLFIASCLCRCISCARKPQSPQGFSGHLAAEYLTGANIKLEVRL